MIPAIYYLVYLGAIWDPQGNFNKLPVAVVNEDLGANKKGADNQQERVNLGKKLTDELIKEDKFKWEKVSFALAEKNLQNGDFYFILRIPANFSKGVVEQGLKPKGLLKLEVNDSLNLVTWQTSSRVVAEIRESVNNQLAKEFMTKITDEVHQNQVDLYQGANKFYQASQKLESGSDALLTGAKRAVTANGKLVQGNAKLGQGLKGISQGFEATIVGQQQVIEGNTKAIAGLIQINEGLQALANAPINDANLIKAQLLNLTQLNNQAISGVQQAHIGLVKVNDGQQKIDKALEQVTLGNGQLVSGDQQLQMGMVKLATGISKLNNGLDQFTNKQKEFRDKLQPRAVVQTVDNLIEPVDVEAVHINKVANNGSVFSAFFIPLTLWVGAIVLMNVLQQLVVKPQRAKDWAIYTSLIGLVSLFQALVVSYASIRVLGLEPKNLIDFYMVNILTSVTFTIIIHLIYFILGLPGILLGLILLVIQLPSTGGTYPIQSLPQAYQTLSQWLPMTYAIRALRFSILGGADYFMNQQIEIFLILIALGVAAHCLWLVFAKNKKPNKLVPVNEVQ